LPQFIGASAAFPVWIQFALLGTIVNLMFSVTDVMCVLVADALITGLRRWSYARRQVRRAGGAIIVGLGVDLMLQKS
jgi:threonine/homoserine/homoserine lactone efflux protein